MPGGSDNPFAEPDVQPTTAQRGARTAGRFGGVVSDTLPGAIVGGFNTALGPAASLASSQPGLSRSQFRAALEALAPEGGFSEFDLDSVFGIYKQLTGGSGATSADDITSPEPEGPGRFGATRPGDLLGAGALRFGS